MESALRIGQRRRKLARDQVGLPDPLHESREALQLGTVLLVGVEDADRKIEFLAHDCNRFSEVRVVRD